MCGICGAMGPSINQDFFKKLLIGSKIRGTDATGFYASYCDDRDSYIVKNNVDADVFFEKDASIISERLAGAKILIGHTRAATIGSCNDNNNNHPLYGNRYVLVHNGSVSTTDSIKDYKYLGKVDSEKALAMIETHGLEGLRKIHGSASLVWSARGDNKVFFWRHTNPMCIGRINGDPNFYWASTRAILSDAIPGIGSLETDADRIYELKFSENMDGVDLLEGNLYQPSYATTSGTYGGVTWSTKKSRAFLSGVPNQVVDGLASAITDLCGSIAKNDISILASEESSTIIVRDISDSALDKLNTFLFYLNPEISPKKVEIKDDKPGKTACGA